MAINLNNAKAVKKSNGTQAQRPTPQATQQTEQAQPQPLALPNQSMVLFQQLKTATKADMAAIDRMFEKRREVVSAHYDRRATEFGKEMAEKLGIEVGEDFFAQSMTLDAALAEFDDLLKPSEELEPEEQPPDAVLDTTAIPVEVMPSELAA